jgi:hypothetical protein
MKSVFLQGGLGNQLFQIAVVIAYCIEHCETCMFTYDEILTSGVPRKTYWNTLLKKCKVLTNYNNKHITNEQLMSLSKYMEPSFNYQKIPEVSKPIMFAGYFQSYKYFIEEQDEVFAIMGLRDEQAIIQEEFNKSNHKKNTVCMHFRLGDYKEKQDCHPVMPYEYYEKGLRNLSEEFLKNSTIYYLCEEEDDVTVSEMVKRLQDTFQLVPFVKVDFSEDDWKQMLFMSCCQVNIIANSSFSCWAGYLNKHPEKIVMYPCKWFGPKIPADTRDMFLPDWIQITF